MFWGREGDLDRVRVGLTRRGLVALHGPFGIGKSALVRELADERDGVRFGQALPALRSRAYQPLLHATSVSPQPGEARAASEAFRAALARDDLLVLEDLHWADNATLEALVELRGHCQILVTVQDGAPGADRVLRLVESLGGTIVGLGPLDDDSIDRFLEERRPDLLAGERHAIAAGCGGNPLVAGMLVDGDELAPAGVRGAGRATVTALVERLPGPARQSLAVLAHVTRPVTAAALGGIEELLASGLVEQDPGGAVTLCHPVVGTVAADRLQGAERAEVFARLAAEDDLPAVSRAELLLEAGDDQGALDQAMEASYRPVPRAEQAAALWVAARAATRLADVASPHALAGDEHERLVLAAVGALNDSIRYDDAASLLGDPLGFSEPNAMWAAIEALRAALGRGDRSYSQRIGRLVAPIVAAHDGPDALRARSMCSMLDGWPGTSDDLRHLAREQLEIGRSGKERSHAAMLVAITSYGRGADHVADIQTWFAVAKQEAEHEGSLASELLAARNLMMVQVAVGAHDAARAVGSEAIAKAEAAGEEGWVIELRTLSLLSRYQDGEDLDGVLSWMSYVRTAPVRLETRALATNALATLLADRGQAARSAAVLAPWLEPDALAGFDLLTAAMIMWSATQRAWVLGDLPEAIRVAREATEALPPAFPALAGMQVVWRWAELESGAPITAPSPAGGLLDSARLEAEAIDLLVAGRHREAADAFLAAAESWRPVLVRCTLRCEWGAGLALARAGDAERALALLDALDAELDRRWCPALRPRVAAARRLAHRGSSRSSLVEPTATSAVTPRERTVLRLVAEGLTSTEIARRLGLSVATVNTHVQSAKRKLGARTRIEAAARISRNGD